MTWLVVTSQRNRVIPQNFTLRAGVLGKRRGSQAGRRRRPARGRRGCPTRRAGRTSSNTDHIYKEQPNNITPNILSITMGDRGQSWHQNIFPDRAFPPYASQGFETLTEDYKGIHVPGQQNTEVTVVTLPSTDSPEKDHLVWSIVNTIYLNFCCLGLWALAFSVKSRDQKFLGNRNEASRYGSLSRSLNIAATTCSIVFFVLWIVLLGTGVIPL
ncbi:interferon-induced transmembrane protein 3-like [Pseudophryne corroboree]|uniref:interferon-induced transmembrane protein 3-like n=1 Tax=Pseudophryne corroboree TaxID=495146 RepID=UPI00308188E6